MAYPCPRLEFARSTCAPYCLSNPLPCACRRGIDNIWSFSATVHTRVPFSKLHLMNLYLDSANRYLPSGVTHVMRWK